MTFVRRAAVRIAGFVVSHASSGCREWAEGLAREIEFIEGDWAALGWAVGSTRVLLDPAPSFVEWSWWVVMLMAGFEQLFLMSKLTNWPQRMGTGLIAFGWVYWMVSAAFDWFCERSAPPSSDIHASRLFRRDGLEKKLKRSRSIWRWVPLVVTVAVCIGYVLVSDGVSRVCAGLAIAGGLFSIWMQCLDSPRKIQRRIEQMNARIAGR